MQIDWITVSAQIVNFLILVWLLKRFLYAPVMVAMEQRERRIADRLNDARQREEQAAAEVREYRQRSDALTAERERLIEQARREAEERKLQWLEQAREEVAATRSNWQQQTREEHDEFIDALRRRTAGIIQSVARSALRDLADAQLEETVVEVFIRRLKALDREERRSLRDGGSIRIRSAHELDHAVRGRLTRAVHEHIAEDVEVEYAQAPELLCGIELYAQGRRIAWHLADYLDDLVARVEDALSPRVAGSKS